MPTHLTSFTSAVAAGACLFGSLLMAEPAPAPVHVQPASDLELRGRLDQPVELGQVKWERDWDAAVARSRETGRPLLVLFDEVPGCHTCVSYGDSVLSHPLIVDAVESLFIPVAVYNNVDGADRKVLQSFGEPEWNNPVVRIMDHERRALTERLNGDYTVQGLAAAMSVSLHEPPAYLALLAREGLPRGEVPERATFAMHCFWEGEAKLGAIDGVTGTTVGFLDGNEVVEVEFDPAQVSYMHLLQEAVRMQCAHRVYTRTEEQQDRAAPLLGERAVRTDDAIRRSTKDELYRLRHSTWQHVPMTRLQAMRINASIDSGKKPEDWVSPRQIMLQQRVQSDRGAGWPFDVVHDGEPLVETWWDLMKTL